MSGGGPSPNQIRSFAGLRGLGSRGAPAILRQPTRAGPVPTGRRASALIPELARAPPAGFFRHCRNASSAARACSGWPVRASREPRASAWAAGRSASEGGSGRARPSRGARARQAARPSASICAATQPNGGTRSSAKIDRAAGPLAEHAVALDERHFPGRLARPVDHPHRQGPPGGVDQRRVEQEGTAGHDQHPALVGAGPLDDQRLAVARQQLRLRLDLEGRVPRQRRPLGVDPAAPGPAEYRADRRRGLASGPRRRTSPRDRPPPSRRRADRRATSGPRRGASRRGSARRPERPWGAPRARPTSSRPARRSRGGRRSSRARSSWLSHSSYHRASSRSGGPGRGANRTITSAHSSSSSVRRRAVRTSCPLSRNNSATTPVPLMLCPRDRP